MIGASLVSTLALNSAKFTDGLEKARKKAKSVSGKIKTSMGSIAKSATKAGAAFAAIGGAGVVKAVGTFKEFEDQMLAVKSVTGATGETFEQLSSQAKDLGSKTSFSASQAAEAQKFLGMAGFETNEILKATPGLLNLAAAGSLELGMAADIASNVLTGMGLSADETNRVVDVMAKTAASSNTSVEQLGLAMSYAAPVAKDFGLSIEETSSYLGKLSDAGIQADKAGTGLRRILGSLAKPSKEGAEALDKLGISVFDAEGQFKGMEDVLDQFGTAMDAGLISQETMFTLFGKQGAGVASVLIQSRDAAKELTDELENAGGAAEKMADIKQSGITGVINQLKSATEALMIAFAESGVIDGVSIALGKLTTGIRDITKLLTGETSLSEILKNWFGADDAEGLGKRLSDAIEKGWGRINELINSVDWSEMGKKVGAAIGTFLTETDWIAVGKAFFNGMKAALTFVGSLFIEMATRIWDALREKLPSWLGGGAGTTFEDLADLTGDTTTGEWGRDNAEFRAARDELEALFQELDKGAQLTKEMRQKIDVELERMVASGLENAEEFKQVVLQALRETEHEAVGGSIIPEMVDGIAAEMDRLVKIANDAATGFKRNFIDKATDSLTEFVMTGKLNFKEFARSIIQDIIRIQIRASLSKLFGGGFGFGGGGGGFLGSVLGVGARAMGGPVTAGKAYVVGENGPELFTPRNSGSIIPNHEMAGGNNININISGNVDDRAIRQIRQVVGNSPDVVGGANRYFDQGTRGLTPRRV